MPTKTILSITIICVSLAAAVWMYNQKSPPQTVETSPPTMFVDVMRAEITDVKITVSVQGSVTPRTETTLISEVAGFIT